MVVAIEEVVDKLFIVGSGYEVCEDVNGLSSHLGLVGLEALNAFADELLV